jgi:3-oxoacyl-[acyl-carrier protein] reductase
LRDCAGTVKAIRGAGGRALGVELDVASLESCKAIAAAVYGLPYALDYSVSKGAVIAMMRSPSAVMTEGTKEFFGEKLEKAKQVIAQGQSLQRNLEVEDLCGTIVYLVSDASRFVAGQTLMVDGRTVFS